jgi:hypothetical protein
MGNSESAPGQSSVKGRGKRAANGRHISPQLHPPMAPDVIESFLYADSAFAASASGSTQGGAGSKPRKAKSLDLPDLASLGLQPQYLPPIGIGVPGPSGLQGAPTASVPIPINRAKDPGDPNTKWQELLTPTERAKLNKNESDASLFVGGAAPSSQKQVTPGPSQVRGYDYAYGNGHAPSLDPSMPSPTPPPLPPPPVSTVSSLLPAPIPVSAGTTELLPIKEVVSIANIDDTQQLEGTAVILRSGLPEPLRIEHLNTKPEEVTIKWTKGGNVVMLARAGDDDWKGRKMLIRECACLYYFAAFS